MNEPLATRERLLEVARTLFAQHGYEGTSVRAITAAAQANLGAITYHFGCKQELYLAVLQSAWEPTLANLEAAAARHKTPLDGIEAAVRALFTNIERQPEIAPIMLREISRQNMVALPVQESIRRLFAILAGLIRAGQVDGSIVPGDAQLLSLSVMAQPFHIMALRHRMGPVIGVRATEGAVFERVVDNAVAFVRRGLSSKETNI